MTHDSYSIHSDGGSRGNPGPAAIGVVIQKGSEVVKEISKTIGITTNNQAEYRALIAGIHDLIDMDAKNVSCYLDSELVVKQLKGEYRVKDKDLRPLFEEIQRLMDHFDHITFTHIRREKNKHADRLVNEALDGSG